MLYKSTKYKPNSYIIGWDWDKLKPLQPIVKKKEVIKSNLFYVNNDFIEKYKLKLNQYLALIILKNNLNIIPIKESNFLRIGKIKNNEIASILNKDKSSISRYMNVLRKKELALKGLYKYEDYWFMYPEIYCELQDVSHIGSTILNLKFYSVCQTIESVLVFYLVFGLNTF